MTNFKKYLIRPLFALYVAITTWHIVRLFRSLKPMFQAHKAGLAERITVRLSGALTMAFWPVLTPYLHYRARQRRKILGQVFGQMTPWNDWPDDWDDDLTPEQAEYWRGEPSPEDWYGTVTIIGAQVPTINQEIN